MMPKPVISPGTKRLANGLGALRLFLAALVVYTHGRLLGGFASEPLARWTGDEVALGTIAVAAFFTLSGTLVATSYARLDSLPRYLWHRTLRLVPAFWVCLAFTAAIFTPLAWLIHASPRPNAPGLTTACFDYFLNNLFQPRAVPSTPPFPAGVPHANDWNGSLWTLFYEASGYLLIGAVGFLGLLRHRRTLVTGLLLVLPILHGIWSLVPDLCPPIISRLYDTPGKLLLLHFMVGAAVALRPIRQLTGSSRQLPTMMTLALALSWFTPWHVWLSPFLMPGLIALFSTPGRWNDFERKAGGDYSYGLYLYHYPVGQLLAAAGVHQSGPAVFTLSILVLSLPLAWCSWRWVEAPALRLKHFTLPPCRETS